MAKRNKMGRPKKEVPIDAIIALRDQAHMSYGEIVKIFKGKFSKATIIGRVQAHNAVKKSSEAVKKYELPENER